MTRIPDPPQTPAELLAALADGELDLSQSPQARQLLSEDPQAAVQIACQQQLRRSVAAAMDGPAMRCPEDLRASLHEMAAEADASSDLSQTPPPTPAASMPPYTGEPVLARIGRWAPAAVAAVLLVAATAVFFATGTGGLGQPGTAVLDVQAVQTFGHRHTLCASDPSERLVGHERFGDSLEQLPGNLNDYFSRSADGLSLDLSSAGYEYQLTGVCSLPGSGSVHIVYQNKSNPDQMMSLWVIPAQQEISEQMEAGRVYVEAAADLDHPVILWEDNGLLFYLVGDSLQDAQNAVQTLRDTAA